jgi:hypothetical protein
MMRKRIGSEINEIQQVKIKCLRNTTLRLRDSRGRLRLFVVKVLTTCKISPQLNISLKTI